MKYSVCVFLCLFSFVSNIRGEIDLTHFRKIKLVDFSKPETAEGWRLNNWSGKGEVEKQYVDSGKNAGGYLKLLFKGGAGASLYSRSMEKVISGALKEYSVYSFYVKVKNRLSTGNAVASQLIRGDGKTVLKFSNRINAGAEWTTVCFPTGGYNKSRKNFEIEKLFNLNILFHHAEGEFDIEEIGIVERIKKLPAAKIDRTLVFVKKSPSAIEFDGRVSASEWKDALKVSLHPAENKFSLCDKDVFPEDRTDIYLTWDEKGVYTAAVCYKQNMGDLLADFREPARDLYKDECVEFYFDPECTGSRMSKYAINANGCVGAHDFWRDEGKTVAKAGILKDRWETEFFIPWEALGVKKTEIPFNMGFNATRTTYADGKMKERTGWETANWRAVKDFGVLVLGNEVSDENDFITETSLFKRGGGFFSIKGKVPQKGVKAILRVFSGNDIKINELKNIEKTVSLDKGDFSVDFSLPPEKTRKYRANLMAFSGDSFCGYYEAEFAVDGGSDWRALSVDDIALFPEPESFKKFSGFTTIPQKLSVKLISPGLNTCFELLKKELKDFYGISCVLTENSGEADIIIDLNASDPVAAEVINLKEVKKLWNKIKYDGFFLSTENDKIIVSAKQERGAFYAVQSLLSLIKQSTPEGSDFPKVRRARVVDWPAYEKRFINFMMASYAHENKYEVPFYEKMLAKIPLFFRYNGFIFQKDWYYKWKCAPGICRERTSWTPEDYADVIDFINGRYCKVIPVVQSHGHMRWLLRKRRGFEYLREDGDDMTLCTGHPDTYKVLFGFYDEDIDMCSRNSKFKPEYFFASLDEVRWQTHKVPENKRCKYCKGKKKNRVFLDHIKKLNDYVNKKGMRLVMCTDMISETHNGMNQYRCAEIRDELPKNIIMAHWSQRDYPLIKEMAEKGWENWKFSTAYKVDRLNEDKTKGHCFNVCVYNWWLTITRAASAGAYSPMGQALYSNAVWNLFPDQDNTSWMKYTKIYGNWLMRNWSRKPLPGAGKGFFTIDISEVVNDVVTDREKGDGKGWFDMGPEKDLSGFDFNKKTINGIPVRFAKKNGVASFIKFNKLKKEQAKIKINRKLGSLIVLQAANIDAGDYKGYERFRNRKNYKDPLRGLPIAEFTVRYSDGTDAKFYARLGWNLSRWNYDPMFYWDVFAKYVLDARSLAEGKTKHAVDKNLPDDIALYQYEWPNPNPSKTVQSVTVNGLGKYVSYGILALTARNSGK